MEKRLPTIAALVLGALVSAAAQVTISSSLAMHGTPKYPAGFARFDYVNPDAPKGGILRQSVIGTYDNFNRFADRGVSAYLSEGYFFDSLMAGSADEIDVYYGLIAEKVEYPADFSWVIFHINPKARAQDGKSITSDDVVFTFNKFMAEGVPQFKQYNEGVKAEALDPLLEAGGGLPQERCPDVGGAALDAVGGPVAADPVSRGEPLVELGQARRHVGHEKPDDLPQEVVTVQPGPPGGIWVNGYYAYDGYRYVWIGGHWEMPPPGYRIYVAPHWAWRRGSYVYIRGYWR